MARDVGVEGFWCGGIPILQKNERNRESAREKKEWKKKEKGGNNESFRTTSESACSFEETKGNGNGEELYFRTFLSPCLPLSLLYVCACVSSPCMS